MDTNKLKNTLKLRFHQFLRWVLKLESAAFLVGLIALIISIAAYNDTRKQFQQQVMYDRPYISMTKVDTTQSQYDTASNNYEEIVYIQNFGERVAERFTNGFILFLEKTKDHSGDVRWHNLAPGSSLPIPPGKEVVQRFQFFNVYPVYDQDIHRIYLYKVWDPLLEEYFTYIECYTLNTKSKRSVNTDLKNIPALKQRLKQYMKASQHTDEEREVIDLFLDYEF